MRELEALSAREWEPPLGSVGEIQEEGSGRLRPLVLRADFLPARVRSLCDLAHFLFFSGPLNGR